MAEFSQAFDFIMAHEDPYLKGAVVKEPAGGVAKYGINSIAHPTVDVPDLTLAGAEALYSEWYWSPIHGDLILDQAVSNKVMDIGVNLGVRTAGDYLQMVLNNLEGIHLLVDGNIGPKTMAALNQYKDATAVLNGLRQMQEAHYRKRAAEDPKIAAILSGLVVRARA